MSTSTPRWVSAICGHVEPSNPASPIGSHKPCARGDLECLATVVADPSPKAIAKADGRDYITPEDITLSVKAGHLSLSLCLDVLDALESGAAEDPSLCAFVAAKYVRARG